MNDSKKMHPSNHFLAYEAAEAQCMEKYPKIRVLQSVIKECMDISNVTVDIKECKHQLERFSECFNVHKPLAFYKYGKKEDKQ